MKLTHEILHSIGTEGMGWNKHQLELLGVTWPPEKGWLSALIGTDIDDTKFCTLVKLKGVRNRKIRNEIISNSKNK